MKIVLDELPKTAKLHFVEKVHPPRAICCSMQARLSQAHALHWFASK